MIRQMLSRFRRDEKGVTAVEFALVAFPFLVFIFAIIELGISFVAQQMLSSATENLSRQFYTGQLTTENTTPQLVRDKICNQIQFMVAQGCPNLSINLNHYSSFADVPVTGLVTAQGELALPQVINLGGASTLNQLNVLYRWPTITNIFYLTGSDVKPDNHIIPLFTTMTWQNEPY